MLEENGIEFRYREYRKDPLDVEEIRAVLRKLGMSAREVLRRRDRAYAESGLDDSSSDDALVQAMSDHPTLLQRPIGVLGGRAVIGRPVENLLSLAPGLLSKKGERSRT